MNFRWGDEVTSATWEEYIMSLPTLVARIRQCRECSGHLPFAPNPIIRVGNGSARLLIIGQAPGTKVQASGIPWNDASGERLRSWMGVTAEQFYDQSKVAIMPMGFCYPGKGKSGDLPPRPECAPLWHDQVLAHLPHLRLTLLIGQYAQERYLGSSRQPTLTETVRAWAEYVDRGYLPLVHPSPRNRLWLSKNPWFESEIVPELQTQVRDLL